MQATSLLLRPGLAAETGAVSRIRSIDQWQIQTFLKLIHFQQLETTRSGVEHDAAVDVEVLATPAAAVGEGVAGEGDGGGGERHSRERDSEDSLGLHEHCCLLFCLLVGDHRPSMHRSASGVPVAATVTAFTHSRRCENHGPRVHADASLGIRREDLEEE